MNGFDEKSRVVVHLSKKIIKRNHVLKNTWDNFLSTLLPEKNTDGIFIRNCRQAMNIFKMLVVDTFWVQITVGCPCSVDEVT